MPAKRVTTVTLPVDPRSAVAVLAVHCAGLAGSTRRETLWAAATSLDTSTLFGAFGINPRSGVQEKHQTVLVRWTGGKPVPCPPVYQDLR